MAKKKGFTFDIFQQGFEKSRNIMSLEDISDRYAPGHYITMGLLNVDMHLCFDDRAPWETSGTGEKKYGLPTGRIVEFAGQSGSFKTYLGHSLCAETVRMGGVSLHVTTEFDVAERFVKSFYETETLTMMQTKTDLDFHSDIDGKRAGFATANTFEKAEEVFGDFLKTVEQARASGFTGPATIFLDSISGLKLRREVEDSFKNADSNTGAAFGKSAQAKHYLLGLMMERCAELDVLFCYINHLRDSMNARAMGHARWVPGSNKTVEFYPSIRFKLLKGKQVGAKQDNQDFKYGQMVRLILIKKRGYPVANNETYFTHYVTENSYGFDEIDAVLKGMRLAGLLHVTGNGGMLITPKEEWDSPAQQYVTEFLEANPVKRLPEKKMKEFIRETFEVDGGQLVENLITLSKEYGPAMFTAKDAMPEVDRTLFNQDDFFDDEEE